MPHNPYQDQLAAAERAAQEAGALIREHAAREKQVRAKGTHDLVTATDEAAEALITERLQQAFPDFDVLAEEGAAQGAHRSGRPRWIIDPLDGTTNFTHGMAPYSVSIGLQDEHGELVVGVVYEVTRGELYAAAAGRGATLNGLPIRVSGTNRLDEALVATGFPFREYAYVDEYLATLKRFMLESRGVRRPGSAAADLAYVAAGRFDAFFEGGLSPWDVAAGIVLVREAGGVVDGLLPGADPLTSGQIVAAGQSLMPAIHDITTALGQAVARCRRSA